MIRMLKGLIFGVAMVCSLIGFLAAEAKAEKQIGILLWSKSQIYSDSLKGIMDHLKKQGFGEPHAKFIIENAEGSKVKAAALAQKFASAKLDMVIAIGTSAAIAVAKDIKDVPIIFSTVYDPIEAKIVSDWKSSGNNVTGASNKAPKAALFKVLKEFSPVKNLGALYQPNEKNSVAHLKELQEAQKTAQIKVVPIPLTTREEVSLFLSGALGMVDAVFLCGSSIVDEMTPTIIEMATKAKVITLTHTPDRVEKGVLLGVTADSYSVGLLAGERAVKVLKGAKPSTLPIGVLKKFDVLLNMKTAKAGQFQIPPDFIKKVTRTIE